MLLEGMDVGSDFSGILVQFHQELLDPIGAADQQEARIGIEKHLVSSFKPVIDSRSEGAS